MSTLRENYDVIVFEQGKSVFENLKVFNKNGVHRLQK